MKSVKISVNERVRSSVTEQARHANTTVTNEVWEVWFGVIQVIAQIKSQYDEIS